MSHRVQFENVLVVCCVSLPNLYVFTSKGDLGVSCGLSLCALV